MTAPFAFLPRAVSKHAKEWPGISKRPLSPSPPPDSFTDSEHEDDVADTSNISFKAVESAHSKQVTIAQDIASLISLALSDYNIWLDADLRWKLDACLRDEARTDEAGFVPINYLLRRTPFRGSLPLRSGQLDPPETEVVRALRTHVSHILEVRIRLPSSSAPSSSVWYGTGKTSRKKDMGGYEVRRRDWLTLHNRPSRGWTRARWDEMTVYMECIPAQYRTVGSIGRFAETLLSSLSETRSDIEPHLPIQNVTLPPHYLDKPGDTPKCKGYALVTFSTRSHVEAVLRVWPWKRRRASISVKENEDENASPLVKEARKYGLRMISKARWDALNEEYLLYKQHLVDEIAQTQTGMHHLAEATTEHETDGFVAFPGSYPNAQAKTQTQITPCSPYPFDCLVFVRNIHPETNKTTLKSLFAQGFQDGGGLDYVDFSKGMGTCYLRLASPRHTMQLVGHFGAQRKAQTHGLDATGRTPLEDDKPIVMERIHGIKEGLYWEKVPEKVRRQAVDKAIKASSPSVPESSMSPTACGPRKRA